MASTLNARQKRVSLGILVGAWLIMVAPLSAAQDVDSRWVPWVGCWRAVNETDSAPVLCVVPLAGEEAVEMLTMLDGQVVSRESIFIDGQQHAVSTEDCEGWEGAEFSRDSRRIYIRSELNCGASGVRISTGVLSMVSPFEWLDVRTMNVDGQSVPWALRYTLASRADFQVAGQGDLVSAQGPAARMARMAASVPIALDDVVEATEKVSAETVQLWIVERGEPFVLDANRLIEVADALALRISSRVVFHARYRRLDAPMIQLAPAAASTSARRVARGRGRDRARPRRRTLRLVGASHPCPRTPRLRRVLGRHGHRPHARRTRARILARPRERRRVHASRVRCSGQGAHREHQPARAERSVGSNGEERDHRVPQPAGRPQT